MADYKKLIEEAKSALHGASLLWDRKEPALAALASLEAILDEMQAAVREYAMTVNNDDVDAHQLSGARLVRLATLEGGTNPKTDERDVHPAYCGGTYDGVGFVAGTSFRRWRARCINHGNRLVEGPPGGPYEYIDDPTEEQ